HGRKQGSSLTHLEVPPWVLRPQRDARGGSSKPRLLLKAEPLPRAWKSGRVALDQKGVSKLFARPKIRATRRLRAPPLAAAQLHATEAGSPERGQPLGQCAHQSLSADGPPCRRSRHKGLA